MMPEEYKQFSHGENPVELRASGYILDGRTNGNKNGDAFHNVTIARRYESCPREWSKSSSFYGI